MTKTMNRLKTVHFRPLMIYNRLHCFCLIFSKNTEGKKKKIVLKRSNPHMLSFVDLTFIKCLIFQKEHLHFS